MGAEKLDKQEILEEGSKIQGSHIQLGEAGEGEEEEEEGGEDA